jgi:hypothetical protein
MNDAYSNSFPMRKSIPPRLKRCAKDARDASFNAFATDPDWQAAKGASEKARGGSLTSRTA